MIPIEELWRFLPVGYLFTIAVETPILLVGLSAAHTLRRRLLAGIWLTACTYPIVVLVLPPLTLPFWGYHFYLAIAETFAPLAECGLFYLAFARGKKHAFFGQFRDYLTIVLANVASFLLGVYVDVGKIVNISN